MGSKERLIEELKKESDTVVSLAYMYARGYNLCGEDVTKAWTNAVNNNHLIETIYQRGYEDAFKDIAEKKRKDFYHKVVVDLLE